MDPLIRPGQTLRMERGQAVVIVDDRIGEGGVGVVHRAGSTAAPFAVKWYRPGPFMEEHAQVHHRAAAARSSAAQVLRLADRPGQLAARFPGSATSCRCSSRGSSRWPQMLNRQEQPSFRVVTTLGRELVDAFAVLHATGLCYRDISFGNVRVDPEASEVAIIDIDNIGTDGGQALVKGTGPFMAPEVLRDEALPSTVTDLHSLAVFLFYLLMHGHPLEGAAHRRVLQLGRGAAVRRRAHAAELRRLAAVRLRPDDDSATGRRLASWSASGGRSTRRASAGCSSGPSRWDCTTRRSTAGSRRAPGGGRCSACTTACPPCPGCGAAAFYDQERPDQRCWSCHQTLPVPPRLEMPGGTLVLSEGAVVTSHHLYRDRGYRSICAAVERIRAGRAGWCSGT